MFYITKQCSKRIRFRFKITKPWAREQTMPAMANNGIAKIKSAPSKLRLTKRLFYDRGHDVIVVLPSCKYAFSGFTVCYTGPGELWVAPVGNVVGYMRQARA